MPEFRKGIIALAGVALFAGLASAQVGPTGGSGNLLPPTCTTTNGAVTPTVRTEGYTELTGDIVIVCTGGTSPALGTTVPTTNITIFLNTAVTSRLLPTSTVANASEALLLIDEPGSALAGYGPQVPQTLCGSAAAGAGAGGCTQIVGTTTTTPAGTVSGVPVAAAGAGGAPTFTGTPGANIFQGVVNGSSVTFFGVPALPPNSVGASRVLRITNIRANANGVAGGGPTPGSIVASISTNGSSSLPITNSTLTVGFVQQGLNPSTTGVRNSQNTGTSGGPNFPQCNSVSVTSTSSNTAAAAGLQYQENFGTAFKVRTQGVQNIPGTIYNSESGFFLAAANFTNAATGLTNNAGLADYGTRLKAVFNNVPSGVSLFVSVRDVQNNFATGANAAQAVLVVSETAVDSGMGNNPPTVPQTAVFPSNATVSSGVGIAPLTIIGGSGEAVWEIINTNPAAIDTVNFAVYVNFTANPANNTPAAPSTISVTLSYAPTPSGGAFTSSTGSAASSSLTIPRFSDSLNITKTFATFSLCTTDLLYPYVINTNGFDTGLAIANTTTDPFQTAAQQGTCTLNFYGSAAPTPNTFVTPSIASGTVYANLASTVSPGFSGYIIAVCNFQFAHGFAFVSDVGARNLAMGYLALVLNNGSNLNRGTTGEALNN